MSAIGEVRRLGLALLIAAAAPAGAEELASGELRNARYCEVIALERQGIGLAAVVYNTLGLNDCPDTAWSQLTPRGVKRELRALSVMLNGPRHWVLDGILADGATATGKTIDVGGIGLTARATLELSLFDLWTAPYEERQVERSTRWLYKAGQPMFVLSAPGGARYAMQSYAQMVDRDLAYDDLAGLGAVLNLPPGWSYTVETPATDVSYPSDGQATIVQDELLNTYQRLPGGG
jgi:hypothetical protein